MDPVSVLIVLAALWGVVLIVGVGMVYYCLWKAQKVGTFPRSPSTPGKETALVFRNIGETSGSISVELERCQDEGECSRGEGKRWQGEVTCASTSGLQHCPSSFPSPHPLAGDLECSLLSDAGDKRGVTLISVEPCLCHADTKGPTGKGGQPVGGEAVTALHIEDMESSPSQENDASVTFNSKSEVTTRNASPKNGPPSSLPPVVD